MPHAPEVPSGTPIEFNPTELTEFYVAAAGDAATLVTDDLVPLSSGGDGFSPTRSVNRQPLHNGRDIISVGSLQGGDTSIDVYLDPNNEKMALFRDSLRNGTHLIFNMFYRDGTGVAGYCAVTSIAPTTDPNAIFAQTINISTFNVNLIDAPVPAP